MYIGYVCKSTSVVESKIHTYKWDQATHTMYIQNKGNGCSNSDTIPMHACSWGADSKKQNYKKNVKNVKSIWMKYLLYIKTIGTTYCFTIYFLTFHIDWPG